MDYPLLPTKQQQQQQQASYAPMYAQPSNAVPNRALDFDSLLLGGAEVDHQASTGHDENPPAYAESVPFTGAQPQSPPQQQDYHQSYAAPGVNQKESSSPHLPTYAPLESDQHQSISLSQYAHYQLQSQQQAKQQEQQQAARITQQVQQQAKQQVQQQPLYHSAPQQQVSQPSHTSQPRSQPSYYAPQAQPQPQPQAQQTAPSRLQPPPAAVSYPTLNTTTQSFGSTDGLQGLLDAYPSPQADYNRLSKALDSFAAQVLSVCIFWFTKVL